MKEIILKKVSVYKTNMDSHLLEIIKTYVEQHKDF